MSRYWSVEECRWVQYSSAPVGVSVPEMASGAEISEAVPVTEQIPEQVAAMSERAPSVI